MRTGVLVFARYGSRRLPGKALRDVGGMPLLERVIRRAQLTSLPVYLATTDNPSDDPLVALAARLGVQSFRGAGDRVLERAVLAAETFELDVFVRLCGDRPLFCLDDMNSAVVVIHEPVIAEGPPDLVTNYYPGVTARGLTTEVVRTQTLREQLGPGLTPDEQEHVTTRFYDRREDYRVIQMPYTHRHYDCPGFAVDTETDLRILNGVFAVSDALDLSPAQADRIYRA